MALTEEDCREAKAVAIARARMAIADHDLDKALRFVALAVATETLSTYHERRETK